MWADIEDVTVAYLADLFAPGCIRGGPEPADFTGLMPYGKVVRVAGDDDKVTDYPSIDIDFFHWAGNYAALSTLSRRVHDRMRVWTNKVTVTLPGTGERVRIDRCLTAQVPVLEDYADDSVVRMVGRYRLENRAQTAA